MTQATRNPAEILTLLDVKPEEHVRVDERVSDEELLREGGYFVVIGAFSRSAPQEGSTITKAMETWHGYGEVSAHRWIKRSVAGRAHLTRTLMAQAQYHGLAFLDVKTGEILPTPSAVGAFNLVDRKTGEPMLLACTVGIDKTKGRMSGAGRAYHYTLKAAARSVKFAVSKLKELPMDEKSALAIEGDDANDAAAELDQAQPAAEEPTTEGKAKRRR